MEVIMKQIVTTLDKVPVGKSVLILSVSARDGIRRRLTELGFIRGAKTTCIGESPLGDPKAFLIDGAVIALRKKDCASIDILQGEYIEQAKG